MGTKFKPLLRTDFSESESCKFSGMITTVLRFSGDESLVQQQQQLYFFHPKIYKKEKFIIIVQTMMGALAARNNLRVEFLGLNLVQIFKKFRIGILNFGTNEWY